MQITITKVCHRETRDSFGDIHDESPRWKHCCDNNTQVFPLTAHNIYSEVAMVTIQEVLPAVISDL